MRAAHIFQALRARRRDPVRLHTKHTIIPSPGYDCRRTKVAFDANGMNESNAE